MENKIFTNLPSTSNTFKLKDVYCKCYNITSKHSIRFYLQKLRDNNMLVFHGNDKYSFTDKGLLQHIFRSYSMNDVDILNEILINNS
jgi:repressor of nif and glnA expression